MDKIAFIMFGIAIIISVISLILATKAQLKYKRLYRQYDYFMRGKDAETLEDVFISLNKEVEFLLEEDKKNKDLMRVINRNIRASIQKIGITRYNALGDPEGQLSFAIAALDYTNTGFVLNSVHLNDGSYMYIKEVDAGSTAIELSDEEKEALEKALGY